MKTVIPSGQNIPRNWHVIDAENLVLGRLASKAANILMGKHKPMTMCSPVSVASASRTFL